MASIDAIAERTPYGLPFPKTKNLTLTEDQDLKGKQQLVIIGDIHGCYDELEELLEKCKGSDPGTLVLCVGDLVNKGPNSLGVVKHMHKIGALCVRGNHDEVCLEAWQNFKEKGEPLTDEFKWMLH